MDISEQIEYLLNNNIDVLPSKEALIEKLKLNRPLKVKLGIDPTSPHLHLGHTVCLQLLKRFQDLGHEAIILIGGFTACLGDPTGRNETRPPLSVEDVEYNTQTYLDQITKILDLKKATIVNNKDWLNNIQLAQIIELFSKHTVNQMIAKEAFGTRLDQGHALYMHELLYPVLQGYDSVHLKADIELGGQDQRFNLLTGRDMQKSHNQAPQVALMTPLLVGLDGVKKMSKSYNNFIGITERPAEIYGKVMSLPDELLLEWYSLVISLKPQELKDIQNKLQDSNTNPRDIKMQLARDIITLYYSEEQAHSAEQDFIVKFQKREIPEDIELFTEYKSCNSFIEILVMSKLIDSNSEAKRKIKEGAVKINSEKITDISLDIQSLNTDDVIQVGRRKFIKLG